MRGRKHMKGPWVSRAATAGSVVSHLNNPFAGLRVVSINAKNVGDISREERQTVSSFKPPLGPKHLPLSQCPNLSALLQPRDKKTMDHFAADLQEKQHDLGFTVTLEPGTRREVREIFGVSQETFASWNLVVRRDWMTIHGRCKSANSECSLRVEDNRLLAAALYLADKLGAKTDKLHLFKPFRPSAYVEAWLAERLNSNPALAAKARSVGGRVYIYRKDGAVSMVGECPLSLFVGETEYPLKNWRDLMVKTCDVLCQRNKSLLRELSQRVGDKFLSGVPDGMRTPRIHVPSGLYLELYLPPYSHILHSQLLFLRE